MTELVLYHPMSERREFLVYRGITGAMNLSGPHISEDELKLVELKQGERIIDGELLDDLKKAADEYANYDGPDWLVDRKLATNLLNAAWALFPIKKDELFGEQTDE